MNQYKEFQGKTLDDAIKDACDYYGVAREKLEIEILSDAKSGIFGLVGAKKASIRATRVEISDTVTSLLEPEAKSPPKEQAKRPADRRKAAKGPTVDAGATDKEAPGAEPEKTPKEAASEGREKGRGPRGNNAAREPRPGGRGDGASTRDASRKKGQDSSPAAADPRPARQERVEKDTPSAAARERDVPLKAGRGRNDAPHHKNRGKEPRQTAAEFPEIPLPLNGEGLLEAIREELPEIDLERCDQERLFDTVRTAILRLVSPIVGQVPCEVSISGQRVRASLDCGDASGLLVGRDGQTLAAVQYLAARIISRRLGGAVRLQIDAGKYRERQDDKLRDLARYLAERVKETGRAQTTRPLSAYQRRVVHLALEHDGVVHTRSKGEGAQRRVIIYPRRESAEGLARENGIPPEEALLPEAALPMEEQREEPGDAGLVAEGAAPLEIEAPVGDAGEDLAGTAAETPETDTAAPVAQQPL